MITLFTSEELKDKTPEQIIELAKTKLESNFISKKEFDDLKKKYDDIPNNPEHFQKLIKERDEAKEAARLAKEKLDNAGAGDDAKALKLKLDEANQKIATFDDDIKVLKQNQADAEAKAKKAEEELKADLISKLPDTHKEYAKKITDIGLLKEYIELNKKPTTVFDTGKTRPQNFYDGKNWNDLSFDDKQNLKKTNPAKYQELLKNRNKK